MDQCKKEAGPTKQAGTSLSKEKETVICLQRGDLRGPTQQMSTKRRKKICHLSSPLFHFPLPCKRRQQVLRCHHELQMSSKYVWTQPKHVSEEAHAASEFQEPTNDNTDNL